MGVDAAGNASPVLRQVGGDRNADTLPRLRRFSPANFPRGPEPAAGPAAVEVGCCFSETS